MIIFYSLNSGFIYRILKLADDGRCMKLVMLVPIFGITLDINYGYRDAIASLIELNTFGLMPACFVDSEYGC